MKRLQIYIDEDLDAMLGVVASREGVSKAALIRECVASRYQVAPDRSPSTELVGWLDGEPGDSAAVDDVVYGA